MKDALEIDSQLIDNVISNPNSIYESEENLQKMLINTLSSLKIDIKFFNKLDLTQIWSLLEKRLSNDIQNYKEIVKAPSDTLTSLTNEIKAFGKEKLLNNKRHSDDNLDEINDEEEQDNEIVEEQEKPNKKKEKKQKKKEFFDMNVYKKIGEEGLRQEDYLENDENLGEEKEDDDGDELGDDENKEIDAKNINYEDFFDPVEDKDEKENFQEQEEDSDEGEEAVFKKENEFLNADKKEIKALINKTITDDIDKIESKMIGDKPWQMKGEITAKDRKKGSLLEQVVEYQVSIKPPPVPTPQFTNDIESMIIKRVKDGLFDNPVRKEHIDINEAPKKGEMKFDKSKKGLGEIYEDEYTEKVMHLPNETEQTEIKKEVDEIERRLFSVLDRLTNFNYVPKINKEMKVLTNVPSIALEDISNHLTDNKAFSKAPQELFNIKDTNFESKDEMSKSEKKNLHNKKKRNIRTHLRQKQQYNKLKNLYDKTGDKFEAKMLMRKEQDKKVNKESKVSDLKSGKFFNNMQKIVSNDIEKRNGKKEKNNSERGNNEQKIKNFKL